MVPPPLSVRFPVVYDDVHPILYPALVSNAAVTRDLHGLYPALRNGTQRVQHACEFMSSKVARLIICADSKGGEGLLGIPRGENELQEVQTTLSVLQKIRGGYDVQILELMTRAQVYSDFWDKNK